MRDTKRVTSLFSCSFFFKLIPSLSSDNEPLSNLGISFQLLCFPLIFSCSLLSLFDPNTSNSRGRKYMLFPFFFQRKNSSFEMMFFRGSFNGTLLLFRFFSLRWIYEVEGREEDFSIDYCIERSGQKMYRSDA